MQDRMGGRGTRAELEARVRALVLGMSGNHTHEHREDMHSLWSHDNGGSRRRHQPGSKG